MCKDDLRRTLANDEGDMGTPTKIPFAEICAKRIVQHVEAESPPRRATPCALECCSERNVPKNSRERRCSSVLPDRLAKAALKYDLEEEGGTDFGKVLIGQNNSVVTKKGA